MQRKIDTVLFDLDGTLLNTQHLRILVMIILLKKIVSPLLGRH